MSTAFANLETGAQEIFAAGPSKALGVVEFSRPDATAGAVRVLAGTLVATSKGGRTYRTLTDAVFGGSDVGPVGVAAEAIDYGWQYNVKGRVITPSAITLPGEIDTIVSMRQADAAGVADFIDATFTVAQILDFAGGAAPMLDGLGEDRGVYRGPGESDETYRHRILSLPDTLTPAAIRRALDALADAWGVTYELVEVGDPDFQTVFDYPSPNAGVPESLSPYPSEYLPYERVHVYDDPRGPNAPYANRWVDAVEYRGAFIVAVVAPAAIAEYAFHYDSIDDLPADRQTLNGAEPGFFALSAYDLPADLDPAAGVAGAYDATDAGLQGFLQAWWDTLQALKAAGVVAGLELITGT